MHCTSYYSPKSFLVVAQIVLLTVCVSDSVGQTERQGGLHLGSEPDYLTTAPNVVTDIGFDAGTPNPFWNEFSTNFGTPICSVGVCGTGSGTGPRSGDFWVWFGGIGGIQEHANVSQIVTLDPGLAFLIFYTEAIICDSATDFLDAMIDSTPVLSINGADASCGSLGYTIRAVDVSAFADGAPHLLQFEGRTFSLNAGVTNFFLDDVVLDAAILPVELTSFTARMTADGAILNWTTASERNNAGFDVEHARDGSGFEPIAFVDGRGTTNEPQSYDYRISDLQPGSHSFRLKQIDFDGSFEYSAVIEAQVVVPNRIWLAPVYPNPFNPTAIVKFAVPTEQHIRVQVYDVTGRIVGTLFDAVAAANTPVELRFDGTNLESGVYLIRVEGRAASAMQTVTYLK